MEEDKLYCPHCGSTQLTANKKGFGVGKAAAGAILTGGVGLLAGFIGSGKVKVTCLKCGKTMDAGSLCTSPPPPSPPPKPLTEEELKKNQGCGIAFFIVCAIIIIAAIIVTIIDASR